MKIKNILLYTFIHGATNALDGRKCIGHSGAEIFASEEYQKKMDGAFILVPLANEKRDENGTLKDSWGAEYVSIIKKWLMKQLRYTRIKFQEFF